MRPVLRSGVIVLCLLWLAGCGGGGGSSSESGSASGGPPPLAASALQPASETSLTGYFRSALQRDANFAGDTRAFDQVAILAPGAATGAASTTSATSSFSTTTLQEAGVDEADLVKTDGSVIYSITAGGSASTIRRHRIPTSGTALTQMEDYAPQFGADVVLNGLYLDAARQQLAAVAGTPFADYYTLWFSPQYWRTSATEVLLLDVSDPATTQARYKLRLDGQIVGSRRIDSTLYLVLRSYPRITGFDYTWAQANTAGNQQILSTLQAGTLLPTVRVDSQPAAPLVTADNCFLQDANAYATSDIITIVAVDLASATPRTAARCFVGSTEAIYVSERSLYLATTRTAYTRSSLLALYPATMSTDIHKFALNGLGMDYRGSGQVDGHLGWDQNRKSFRFGEQNEYLRVITFTGTAQVVALPVAAGSTAASSTMVSPATLSILQESASPAAALSLVSTLPNDRRTAALGKPGEQLYATRFLGNRGYLVTYRLTDPLYVLDLSDPLDPKIGGELQVSGYSDYLFPLTENLLLGVGKDAVSDGTAGDGRFAWYQGVKVSLIDVSQPSAPREVARQIIGRRGTDATVLHDHHGIAIQNVGSVARVALPVNLHDSPPVRPTGAPSDTFSYTQTGLYRFDIDTAANTLAARSPLVAPVAPTASAADPAITSDRSVLAGDQVHYLRNFGFISGPW